MHGRLVGKNLLITGSAGRIGSATARAAISEGASVVLADISGDKLKAFKDTLSSSVKARVHPLIADVTTEAGIISLLDQAVSATGPLTSAVHSAYPTSYGWGSPFEKLRASHLHEDLANQLGGAILFSQHILRHFQAHTGGDLVHISSIQGICSPKFEHYEGTTMTSPIEYSTIKAGVIAMTRWLAKYHSNQNIRVNCVSPGGILDKQDPEFLKRYRSSCTNYGMLSSEQVASAVIFLLSAEAEAINGQNLIVDDGWSL
ncbi:MAG: SDR family oxidoreductase [Vulcanococcus sp.]|jgi:NAD(P)-dependent dehydrogenase (short-subunit alcohol dehydrogenase family)|uniref:oxidoreductase n=1 Tax=Vulcanococcus sp. TaxID=2856995 RepID=UPI0025E0B702|nr:oxidoreductase [Vulcanococcus sp.]MBW0180974.1 SDR family oxidoreductase [Vulcanococcus sp.]